MSAGRFSSASAVYTSGNTVRLVKGGRDYFDLLLNTIRNARFSIHLQTYIFDYDETGKKVADALLAAAARGVHIFLLLDGYASQHLPKEFINRLKKNGISLRWFSPLLRTRYFYFGRRLHHKVLVADARVSLVGGINISDRYNDLPGKPAWLDWAVYAEGDVSHELFRICIDLWNKSSWSKKNISINSPDYKSGTASGQCFVRVRRNDWVNGKNQISRSYVEMLKKAGSHIYIMSSYFLPGKAIRKHMLAALKRGVRIRIIAAGKSDVWVAKQAERFIYSWLLKNKIELYEYQPSILHGKLSSYDGKWVTVGSYNVNNISAYAAIELNLDVLDSRFAGCVESRLQNIIENDCVRIDEEAFKHSNTFFRRMIQKVAYEFIRVVFELFTFYFRKHSDRE